MHISINCVIESNKLNEIWRKKENKTKNKNETCEKITIYYSFMKENRNYHFRYAVCRNELIQTKTNRKNMDL